jgi:cell division protein FtsI (penicillin-binding protein 3)
VQRHEPQPCIPYTTSPLLASKTPVWRSKFIVGMIALGFVGLGLRAAYVQVVGNEFFQRQGEVRFARTLELPANRGRILDRNGLILASSVPRPASGPFPRTSRTTIPRCAPSSRNSPGCWACRSSRPDGQAGRRGQDLRLGQAPARLGPVGQQIVGMGIKGIYLRKEYKRQYPEGEAAAHVVGFTNVEDKGQEGMELAFNDLNWPGAPARAA